MDFLQPPQPIVIQDRDHEADLHEAEEHADQKITELTQGTIDAADSANSAASNANNAAQIASAAASNANVQAQRAEDAADFVEGSVNAQLQKSQYAVPAAMAIDYPAEITIGNHTAVLRYTITPANAMRNVIFYKGTDKNDAVLAVHPISGALTPIAAGTAKIYVIPTANTGIYKSCTIAVRASQAILDNNSDPITDNNNNQITD